MKNGMESRAGARSAIRQAVLKATTSRCHPSLLNNFGAVLQLVRVVAAKLEVGIPAFLAVSALLALFVGWQFLTGLHAAADNNNNRLFGAAGLLGCGRRGRKSTSKTLGRAFRAVAGAFGMISPSMLLLLLL